jgi:hypothetical protein
MKISVKHPRSVDGKHYGKGLHEVPDSLQSHWFVQALLKTKDFEILDEPKSLETSPATIEVAGSALEEELPVKQVEPEKKSRRKKR